jgi:salicylate hydroxylase
MFLLDDRIAFSSSLLDLPMSHSKIQRQYNWPDLATARRLISRQLPIRLFINEHIDHNIYRIKIYCYIQFVPAFAGAASCHLALHLIDESNIMSVLKIGIVGAGIGGLTAAIALHKMGHDVVVFEQSKQFLRVGADINLTPNAVRALNGLNIAEGLHRTAARPTHRISRTWDTGEETSRLEMGETAEQKYGAPQLTIHRADLLAVLAEAFPSERVLFAKHAQVIREEADSITVEFADGSRDQVDVLIGADGIHSAVRSAMFGQEKPRFTGVVAFRAVIPAERVAGLPNLQAFTKWWGPTPESQIVSFPLNGGKDIFIFATAAQESWHLESWTTQGSVQELRDSYAAFHPDARALLSACNEVLKTALYERDPMPAWSKGNMVLLGDASHPMMPFMAQGAGMSIEDGVVLARELQHVQQSSEVPAALRHYESLRMVRASKIQIGSRSNNWLREGGNADWVYGYDAWTVPVGHATPEAGSAPEAGSVPAFGHDLRR